MSIFVIGGGGHAKVVIATLQAAGKDVAGIVDDKPSTKGQYLLGVPVIGTREEVGARIGRAVIAVGANSIRRQIAESLPGVEWVTAVHPSAVVHESVTIGAGSVVFAGAVIQPDTRIGDHVIVNTGASVDHDCTVGDFIHIAPGCRLAGNITVGDGAFLGIGSSAIPGVRVGAEAMVGAGAVAIGDVEAGATVVGVPARVVRRHT